MKKIYGLEIEGMGKNQTPKSMSQMRGQIAFGLIFLFFGGLLLSALAVDSGAVYFKRARMQKILDSASLNGAAALQANKTNIEVRNLVQNLVEQESELQRIEIDGPLNIQITKEGASSRVQVRADIRTNYLMARFLDPSSCPNSAFVSAIRSAASTATRRPVVLSMVLDVSGSMGGTIESLREAAQNVLKVLDDPRDQIAIISYSTRAKVLASMQLVEPNRAALAGILSGLSTGGTTGIAEGLEKGREQLQNAEPLLDPAVDYRRMVILFTDGVPNIAFARFSDVRDIPAGNTLYFDTLGRVIVDGGGNWYYPPRQFLGAPCMGDPLLTGATGDLDLAAGVCLEKWSYMDSLNNPMDNVDHAGETLVKGDKYDFTRKIFFDMAIREADHIKNLFVPDMTRRVTVYTVGLAPRQPPKTATDPYNFDLDSNYVRGTLLRKIANDSTENFGSNSDADHDPRFDSTVSNLNPDQEKGEFFYVSDPNELTPAFQQIVGLDNRAIRLVEYE